MVYVLETAHEKVVEAAKVQGVVFNRKDRQPNHQASHIPSLDGIRTLAVGGVLYCHLSTPSSWLGHLGVRVFFVLSAFLITGILLDSKSRTSFSVKTTLKKFYTHRLLRILPPYYMILVFLVLFGVLQYDRETLAHFLFMSNYWFASHNTWEPWPTAPLWSLAVEWQFYLVWPFIILLVPTKKLTILCLLIILGTTAFRIYWSVVVPADPMRDIWFPASLDALAIGSLLALHRRWFENPPIYAVVLAIVFVIVTIYLELYIPLLFYQGIDYNWLLVEFLPLLPVTLVIGACTANRWPRLIRFTLGAAPMVGLGRISYGIYLFHFPVLWVLFKLGNSYTWPLLELGWPRLVFVSATTILAAAASWFLLEKPMLRLRKARPIVAASHPIPQQA